MAKQYVLDKIKHKTMSDLIINTNKQSLESSCVVFDSEYMSLTVLKLEECKNIEVMSDEMYLYLVKQIYADSSFSFFLPLDDICIAASKEYSEAKGRVIDKVKGNKSILSK